MKILLLVAIAGMAWGQGGYQPPNTGGGGGGTGTVTHTAGALGSGQIVVGNGGADIKTPSTNATVDASGNGQLTSLTLLGPQMLITGATGATPATPGSGTDTLFFNVSDFLSSISNAGVVTTYARSIARGATALTTGSVGANACLSTLTVAATGVISTDVVSMSPNASIKAVSGIGATVGGLTVNAYPTSGNVNFDICNPSGSSITMGAATVNWSVIR